MAAIDNTEYLIPKEQLESYNALREARADEIKNRILPNNPATYGQLIGKDELQNLAITEYDDLREAHLAIYPEDRFPDHLKTIDDLSKKIITQRIAPYNFAPYEYSMENDQPELFKRFELYNSPEAVSVRAMEKENIFLPYNPLDQREIDKRIEPNKAVRTAKAEEIARWGVNPTDVIDFKGSESFQKDLGFLPRNVTKEDLAYYAKAKGIEGDFKYINPEDTDLGIKFKAKGEDTYKIINSPFIDRQDVKGFLKKEGPAIAGDVLLTVGGTKGFDKVLKGKKFKELKKGTKAWSREMAYLDPSVIGRAKDIGALSFLSATGAAGGDFLRLSVGVEKGYVDRDFFEILKESGMIGSISFLGTAAITSAIKFVPSVWKRFTGQEVPPSFYQQLDDLYEQAAREEAGLGTGQSGKFGEIAYGGTAGTNQEIKDGIRELANLVGKEIGEWNPTLAGSSGNIDANTIEKIFLENADPSRGSWTIYKAIKNNNEEVINRFIKSLNDYYAEGITGNVTGLTVGEGLRAGARSRVDDIETKVREAISNMQSSWKSSTDELDDGSTLLLDDVINSQTSGSQIFTRKQAKLAQIKENYTSAFREEWINIKGDSRYVELFTGAGFTRAPASAWKKANKNNTNNVFRYKDRDEAADEFYKGIDKSLRNRLQGRNPNGTALAGKDEIKFSLEELDTIRVRVNKMASETKNEELAKFGRNLEHGVEKQMQKMVDDRAAELYKRQTGQNPTPKELENWKQENNWGIDLAEAWQNQARSIKDANSQVFKTIIETESPEKMMDFILTTNVKFKDNSQIENFVKIIKAQGTGNEVPELQRNFADWIRINILDNETLSSSQKAINYGKFMRENRGTVKAIYGEEPSSVFGFNERGFKKFQQQLDEYDSITSTLRNKFAPNNPAASPYDFISSILDASKSQKQSGVILFDIKQMMSLAKGNDLLEEQIKTATLRWLTQNMMKPKPGAGFGVRVVDYDNIVKVMADGFGPDDMVGGQLTFENFIKPLLGKNGDAYMKQLNRWADLVSRETAGEIDERATSQALEGTKSIWEYVRKAWLKPLTQIGRRTTAFTKRMGENQREVMAEMILDPKALKKQLDWASGKIRKDAYVRFLVSWGSVASMDLANELEYYDSEEKTQKSPERTPASISDNYFESILTTPERITQIQEGLN